MIYDSIHCFHVLYKLAGVDITDSLDVRCILFKRKSYRISKYYRMEKTLGDRLFGACFGGIFS